MNKIVIIVILTLFLVAPILPAQPTRLQPADPINRIAAPTQPTNRLRNPDFEVFSDNSGVADFWEFRPGHGALASRSTDSKTGSFAQRIDIGAILPLNQLNYVVMNQSQEFIQLQPKQTYRFSFWARGKGQIVTSIILNSYNYVKWGKITALTDAWKRFEYTFTTPDTVWEICELIRFEDNNNFKGAIKAGDWLLLDDAVLEGPLLMPDQVIVNPVISLPGTQVTITAQIQDAGEAIGGLTTEIESPDEVVQATLALFDDGFHGDLAAGDHIYGNFWTTPATPDDYFLDLIVISPKDTTFTFDNCARFSTRNSSLPIPLTQDPITERPGNLLRTSDGRLWLFWYSYKDGGRQGVWFKSTMDLGATWSEETFINLGLYPYYPFAIQSADGRLWVFFDDYSDIWYITSTDMGTTWSAPQQFTTDPAVETYVSAAADPTGRIAVVWNSQKSGNWDIFFRLSPDNGTQWGEIQQITSEWSADQEPAVAFDRQGSIHLVWSRTNMYDIAYLKSDDAGLTWQPQPVITAEFPMRSSQPSIEIDAHGRIWVAFSGVEYSEPGKMDYNWDIYYTGSEGGQPINRLTHFAGADQFSDITLVDGQPWILWNSDRAGNGDMWAGMLGLTQDINPPPYVNYITYSPASPAPINRDVITIQAQVKDETGVGEVHLVYALNQQAPQPEPMFDDGQHRDRQANDGYFGASIGPFPAGTVIKYQVEAQDVHRNIFRAPQVPYTLEVLGPFVKTANILLVADYTYNYSYLLHYYTAALDTNAYEYDRWDCYQRGIPPDSVLLPYVNGAVIWFTPYIGFISEGSVQSSLKKYLVLGGKLFISGQDIGNSLNPGDFLSQFLHARLIQNSSEKFALKGVEDEPLTRDLELVITGNDGANNQYSPDVIEPIAPASTILEYASLAAAWPAIPFRENRPGVPLIPERDVQFEINPATETGNQPLSAFSSQTAALKVARGKYRLVYFAFGFEGILTVANRAVIMDRVLKWLLSTETGVADPSSNRPFNFALDQNYPNPFNPATVIHYQLPRATDTKLEIYNLRGQRVVTLVDRREAAGYFSLIWDGRDEYGTQVASGVYFYRIEMEGFVKVRKLVLLR